MYTHRLPPSNVTETLGGPQEFSKMGALMQGLSFGWGPLVLELRQSKLRYAIASPLQYTSPIQSNRYESIFSVSSFFSQKNTYAFQISNFFDSVQTSSLTIKFKLIRINEQFALQLAKNSNIFYINADTEHQLRFITLSL